ncbi:MAG: DNA polymerase III subunit delta' [Deltaproteobacteria bacterium]|nr:MAG: DNA polymerase III subunit delta' [Deltaproteobacteria bacterium]
MRWEEIAGQERALRILRTALEREQTHHAYLLAGPAGAGKEKAALVFAQAANCLGQARPCQVCEHCTAIARGNFPDVSWQMPLAELLARGRISRADLDGAPSKEIRVDEIRALARRLSLAPLRGRRKVAILVPADAMNERSQNTLLKTLEEPPPATTFLLLSAHPDSLLPTVRSRCVRVQFAPPPGAEAPPDPDLVREFDRALGAEDELPALDLAEARRDEALAVALVFHHWTRDRLVSQPGEPLRLLRQAELCGEVIEALEQNGNGRLQLERLLLGARDA